MKCTALITAIFLLTSVAAQGMITNPMDYRDTEKAYNDYVELLKRHDVYISLPQNYSPINIRGVSYVWTSMGRDNFHMDCRPIDIEAIVEDDSCRVAICYPQIALKFPGDMPPQIISSVHGGMKIEADLRMIHDDMYLDVRPLINIIAEEDMSKYANADTVVTYEFDLPHGFMGSYSKGVGIYLRKKNHPALLLRLMFNHMSYNDKDKYIREALDNIHFGDNPSETFVALEEQESGKSDLAFPTKYRMFTGILPNINDETLEEINRVKAWCEAHGMKELPRLDDATLDALNGAKAFRQKSHREADSILNSSDIPDDKKILLPRMCENWAQFPGDEETRSRKKYWDWLDENMKYPKKAIEQGLEGSVMVDFIVCSDGSIKDIVIGETSKDIDESLKKEAIRLFQSMPRWTPATYKGKSVNSREFGLVHFKLPKRKAQNERKKATDSYQGAEFPEYIYDMKGVPVAPKFNGESGLAMWIQENMQYPADAAKAKIEGRVIVEFIIDKDGMVIEPKVVRGINDALNNEALRVIKSMPRWTPGYSQGKPVKTRYIYPVSFKLAKAK